VRSTLPVTRAWAVLRGTWPAQVAAATIPAAILFGCANSPRFPVSPQSVVSGHEQCTAANGTPDCNAAAHALCRAKGFQAGAGLDTQTEYCFEKSRGGVGNCVFVTRAACH
jgi:hypothetical protein